MAFYPGKVSKLLDELADNLYERIGALDTLLNNLR